VVYRVKGLEIHSENTAQSMDRPAGFLVSWIRALPRVNELLDYGCGKLRYATELARRGRRLTLVDSDTQLSRDQKLGKHFTSVGALAPKLWPTCRVLRPEQLDGDSVQYEFIFCANVLSAIPTRRRRSEVLRQIATALAPSGTCLFVTQYRNSSFNHQQQNANAIRHLDGWILPNRANGSYYGLLNKRFLAELVQRHSMNVSDSWIDGQSAFVLAKRQ
jgi:2-polyprenyl-3-methyl-5-hydroxy-6-metoxy-1,4-benzoquinol methylase